jgi:hypothetical protein
MDAREPQVRRRGFFLHSPDGEPDAIEHENPEGVVIRVRIRRSGVPRQAALSGGRSRSDTRIEESRPQIRSGSVTGSRQRAHLPR